MDSFKLQSTTPLRYTLMEPQESAQKKHPLRIIGSFSLKLRIIMPFFILIGLLMLVWLSLSSRTEVSFIEVLLVSTISFLAAIGLGLFIARQISQRVKQVIDAAEQVEDGKYIHVISFHLGTLTVCFKHITPRGD